MKFEKRFGEFRRRFGGYLHELLERVEVNLSDFFCSLGRVDQECAYCGWHLVKPVTNLSAEQEQEKITRQVA